MNIIIPERLKEIEAITLASGAHGDLREGACVIEAAAYVAGEEWSDQPQCVCPVIAAFCRSWNDALPDDKRNEFLKPIIPRLVGTRNPALEERRALMAADWLVRAHTPAWLRLAGLTTHADTLAGLPEITARAQAPSIRGPIEAARKAAHAQIAAGHAAWAAAGDALRPTTEALQASALDLLNRMIDLEAA